MLITSGTRSKRSFCVLRYSIVRTRNHLPHALTVRRNVRKSHVIINCCLPGVTLCRMVEAH